MNHSFISSGGPLCQKCNRDKIDHTDRATCEVCGNSGNMELMDHNILMCADCQAIEHAADEIRTAERNRRAIETKKKFIQIDAAHMVQTDIFNAETVAIADLAKTMVDMELAVAIDARFQKYSELIFAKKQEIAEAESKIRAIQSYFNELSKKLRQDERDKLKIKDATYVVKQAPKPSTTRAPKAPKFNQTEMRDAIAAAGLPAAAMSMIQMISLRKGISAAKACEEYKRMDAELGDE